MRVGDDGTSCSDLEKGVKSLAHSDDVSGMCVRLDEHICQRVVCEAQNVVALQIENM